MKKTNKTGNAAAPRKQRKTTTYNRAYPIIEAMSRVQAGLEPQDAWNEIFYLDNEPFVALDQVDIEDIEFYFFIEWGSQDELMMETLERSAYDLGYVFDNDTQRFVEIAK